MTEITHTPGEGTTLGGPGRSRMVLAGGSGFLGHVLSRHFLNRGWEVMVLTRSHRAESGRAREVVWDSRTLGRWASVLDGADVLINLAGLSVNCRYHARNRRRLVDSRVDSTRVLGRAIAGCARPPRVWLNSSTATIYRHTFGPPWDENGETGAHPAAKDAFSIEIARAWEREFEAASTPRTRKVTLRSAMVLGLGANSVFPTLRRLTRLGLGGALAGGRQFVSWIHDADFCGVVEWLIANDDASGVFNLAAPNPVTNREMMVLLREVCGVPFGLPAPAWLLEIGAWALRTETELVIKSRRVVSRRLAEGEFHFRYPTLKEALTELLART